MIKTSLLVIVFMQLLVTANAKQLNIDWYTPNKYTDIKPVNTTKTKFRTHLFKDLEAHLLKLLENNSDDIRLNIKVLDLNLAGDVRYNFDLHQDIRYVTDLFWPEITFEYQLIVSDKTIKEDVVSLKDMSFLTRTSSISSRHESNYYEKQLLTTWYKNELAPFLHQHKLEEKAVMK